MLNVMLRQIAQQCILCEQAQSSHQTGPTADIPHLLCSLASHLLQKYHYILMETQRTLVYMAHVKDSQAVQVKYSPKVKTFWRLCAFNKVGISARLCGNLTWNIVYSKSPLMLLMVSVSSGTYRSCYPLLLGCFFTTMVQKCETDLHRCKKYQKVMLK